MDWRLDGWRLPQALIQNIILYTIFGVHQNTYDSLGGFMMQSKTSQKNCYRIKKDDDELMIIRMKIGIIMTKNI